MSTFDQDVIDQLELLHTYRMADAHGFFGPELHEAEVTFFDTLLRDSRLGKPILRDYVFDVSIGHIVWPLRLPLDDNIPERLFITNNFAELVHTYDTSKGLIDANVIESFVYKVKFAFFVLYDLVVVAEDDPRGLVSDAFEFVHSLILPLNYQFGRSWLDEINFGRLMRSAARRQSKQIRIMLFKLIFAFIKNNNFIDWVGHYTQLRDVNIIEIDATVTKYCDGASEVERVFRRLFPCLSKEDDVSKYALEALQNLSRSIRSNGMQISDLIPSLLQRSSNPEEVFENMFKIGGLRYNECLKRYIDGVFEDNKALAVELLNDITMVPDYVIYEYVEKIMQIDDSETVSSLLWKLDNYSNPLFAFVLNRHTHRSEIWLQILLLASDDSIREYLHIITPVVVRQVQQRIFDALEIWGRLCLIDADVAREYLYLIPLYCELYAWDVLNSTVESVEGRELLAYLPGLIACYVQHRQLDTLVVLLSNVDINEFRPYTNILWSFAEDHAYSEDTENIGRIGYVEEVDDPERIADFDEDTQEDMRDDVSISSSSSVESFDSGMSFLSDSSAYDDELSRGFVVMFYLCRLEIDRTRFRYRYSEWIIWAYGHQRLGDLQVAIDTFGDDLVRVILPMVLRDTKFYYMRVFYPNHFSYLLPYHEEVVEYLEAGVDLGPPSNDVGYEAIWSLRCLWGLYTAMPNYVYEDDMKCVIWQNTITFLENKRTHGIDEGSIFYLTFNYIAILVKQNGIRLFPDYTTAVNFVKAVCVLSETQHGDTFTIFFDLLIEMAKIGIKIPDLGRIVYFCDTENDSAMVTTLEFVQQLGKINLRFVEPYAEELAATIRPMIQIVNACSQEVRRVAIETATNLSSLSAFGGLQMSYIYSL